jgi:hypothetical protein
MQNSLVCVMLSKMAQNFSSSFIGAVTGVDGGNLLFLYFVLHPE